MPKKVDNRPVEVKTAIQKASNVETGQKAHHKALMALVALVAHQPIDDGLEVLTLYTSDRVEKAKDTLCTKGTFAWLEECFGIRVTPTGQSKRSRDFDSKGFTEASFAKARAMPWYELTKSIAFKVPTALSMSAIASQAARLEIAGEALPTKDELYSEFMRAVKQARTSTRTLEWKAEYEKRAKAEAEAKAEAA